MTNRARKWRKDDGSIVLSLLVVITLSIIAGTLVSLLAYQSAAVKAQQQTTDAEQAAYNGLVLGVQAISTTYPVDSGIGIELWNFELLPDTPASWESQGTWSEQPNTQRRWWVTPTSVPTQVILTSEGRAGVGNPSEHRYVAYMSYNFNTNAWETTSIIAS